MTTVIWSAVGLTVRCCRDFSLYFCDSTPEVKSPLSSSHFFIYYYQNNNSIHLFSHALQFIACGDQDCFEKVEGGTVSFDSIPPSTGGEKYRAYMLSSDSGAPYEILAMSEPFAITDLLKSSTCLSDSFPIWHKFIFRLRHITIIITIICTILDCISNHRYVLIYNSFD